MDAINNITLFQQRPEASDGFESLPNDTSIRMMTFGRTKNMAMIIITADRR